MCSLRATLCRQALKPCCFLGLWLALGGCSPSSSGSGSSVQTGNKATSALRINELMARNSSVEIVDEDPLGVLEPKLITQDWVELYNTGDSPVRLTGFGLTDDPDRPGKFRFPAGPGTELAPGEFVIVHIVDPDDCESGCDTVDECVDDALDTCETRFEECRTACLDLARCLETASTDEAKQACQDDHDDCDESVDQCRAIRAECRAEATSSETMRDCAEDRTDCLENCNPIGFVARFALGSNETVYLFDRDRMIDRVGVTNPNREQVAEDVEERFTEVSVGRFPDGTGRFGVHYAGATPGAPNLPADVGISEISRVELATKSPACGQDIEVQFSVVADTEELDRLEVSVEYADGCGDVAAGMWTSVGVSLAPEGDEPVDSEDRLDINSEPRSVERSRRDYGAIVPGDCTVQRAVRVRVRQSGLPSVTEGAGCTFRPGQQLPTIAINEYMPRNTTTLRFRYNPRTLVEDPGSGADPTYERPDWLELVNHGAESQRISDLGLVGLGRWRNYARGGRDDLNPWTLADARYATLDGEGMLLHYNVEVDAATFTDFELRPGCHLVILADSDGADFRNTYRPVAVDPEDPPVDEGEFPGDATCQLRDDQGAFFFSTDFGLSASERDANDPDGFVLVYRPDEDSRWQDLDQVVIDFEAIDAALVETDAVTGERQIKANVSFGRKALGEEAFDQPLRVGQGYAESTPGETNTLITEFPPVFKDEVSIVPRNPRSMEPVTVRGRVNFDDEREVQDLMVELRYRIDGDEVSIDAELELFTDGAGQDDALAGRKLWAFTAEIPGQPDGTFVTFDLLARDLSPEGNREVLHGVEDVEGVSFRYLVGFEPGLDAPKISEVLPENESTPLPPFEGMEQRFRDYAEIHNPGTGTLDLSGYYLAQSELPEPGATEEVPIDLARQWRFPDGTTVPPGDVLAVYFGSVPPPYIEVDFGLSCSETLYLIAPDEPELGANSIVDRVSWSFVREDVPCETDRSVARVCGGTSPFQEAEPTPGRPNFEGLLPLEFHSAYHSDFLDRPRNQCVVAGGLGSQIKLNAVFFVDAELVETFNPGRVPERPDLLFEARTIIVTFDGNEDAARGRLNYFDHREPAPDGQASVLVQRDLDLTGIDATVIQYRVEVTDVCGNTIEAGPFSVATAEAEKPTLSINEINLSSALPDAPETPRPWIELVNTSPDEEWDAGGMFITDNPQFPQKATVPEGTLVAPGAFAVVPLDVFESSFDLAESRGTLLLIDSVERGSCEVDALAFDFRGVESGASLGRVPDGTGGIELLDTPSPGESNASGILFVRGDATEDGIVDQEDVERLAAILVGGETRRPACEDALDVDDSGAINISDLVVLTGFLAGGAPLPPPFPEPGTDPTPDGLSCD